MANDAGTELFEDALRFATDAHAGMVRKAGFTPYILHPMEVASIASTMTGDVEVLAAALLHDVVEDTPHTADEIEALFGPRVAELVAAETENKRPGLPSKDTWRIRKEESLAELALADRDTKILWLADKLSNMRSFYRMYLDRGSSFWNAFNQNDPAQQAWYYCAIARLCSELSDELAWQEYDWLVRIVFAEVLS